VGEAKRRREEMRATFLKFSERWSFPASDWEAAAIAEVERLPVVRAFRVPAEQIAYMRMPAQECHTNCRWYEENDPEGKVRAAVGWLPQPGVFVLHSVVERGGKLMCITPNAFVGGDTLDFIPDAKIQWREGEGGVRHFTRDGQDIGPGIRKDPARTIADNERVRRNLLSGMDPLQAVKVD
jgi:hypothetical protein